MASYTNPETLDFSRYSVKDLREKATKMRKWPAYAANINVNAASVNRTQLEAFMSQVFYTNDRFHSYMSMDTAQAEHDEETSQEANTFTPRANAGNSSKPDAAKLASVLAEMIANSTTSAPIDAEQVRAIVKAEMDGYAKVQITINDAATQQSIKLEGIHHRQFPTLLKAIQTKVGGHGANIWLKGPAGSGKTRAAEEAAKALGLEFGFHGAMSMAHELVGFVDANGNYHETIFVRLFREGGLCLLDELDSGENQALLALNAALANGQMSLPNGKMQTRHPEFVCIGAGNTNGQGATAEYVGRNKLDAAFLNRFPIKMSWDYDEALETAISGNPSWAAHIMKARAKALAKGIKVLITPRHTQAGAALIANGFTEKEAAELTYLADMTNDQRKMMEA